MGNLENIVHDENSFISNKTIIKYLLTVAVFGKCIAIAGFLLITVISLFCFIILIDEFSSGNLTSFLFIVYYLGVGVLYFVPMLYLYKSSDEIKKGIYSEDIFKITSGFKNFKFLFTYMGIFTIVVIIFYVLLWVLHITPSVI